MFTQNVVSENVSTMSFLQKWQHWEGMHKGHYLSFLLLFSLKEKICLYWLIEMKKQTQK